jgi:o-succinylbenzoate synthase
MDSIDTIQWYPYRIPFKREFVTAHSAMTAREGAIVEIIATGGIVGVGEIAPLPAFGGESLAAMLALLPPFAAGLHSGTIEGALHALDEALLPAPVLCGLETALLDALGKATGRAVSAILAGDGVQPRSGVPVNAVVGARSIDAAVADAKAALASGFRCVKLKVGWEQDCSREVERIAAVREAIGPDVHLRLDANGGWSRAQAIEVLSNSAQYDIQYVEQPVKADDLEGTRLLRRANILPIAIDEALGGKESACYILDSEAADILVIKPQLIGGLRASSQLMRDAAGRGIGSVVTSSIEAGIGLAAALHLAAATPQISLECGLATLHLLEDDLLIADLQINDGFLAVPGGAGLGIELDKEALERYRLCP